MANLIYFQQKTALGWLSTHHLKLFSTACLTKNRWASLVSLEPSRPFQTFGAVQSFEAVLAGSAFEVATLLWPWLTLEKSKIAAMIITMPVISATVKHLPKIKIENTDTRSGSKAVNKLAMLEGMYIVLC